MAKQEEIKPSPQPDIIKGGEKLTRPTVIQPKEKK